MRKSYFLKKRISAICMALGLFLVKIFIKFYQIVLTKRTILFVTKQKIRSVTLGPISQAGIFLFILWIGNLFSQSLYYDDIINEKSQEISNLKSVNSYFKEQFSSANDKLKKINEYLISIAGNKHVVKAQEKEVFKPKNFKEESLSKQDKQTLNHIIEVNNRLSDIRSIAKVRIKKIEKAIALTGLNIKKIPTKINAKDVNSVQEFSLNDKGMFIGGQGGPLSSDDSIDEAIKSNIGFYDFKGHLEKVKFSNEIDYLILLEKLAEVMPFSRPMKNYYISSGFGSRIDPITGHYATHQGLDFVGPEREKIISPSAGRVILAGKFSDYGNAIVVDHGFGVTTRYGHLSEVKVKAGQIIKQGDVIATQGSTGRSTGSHLHYEVRYKNIPLNPRKFLEAGDALFNDEQNLKYANS